MLYLVSTPIGNLEDMTLRAIRVLKEADVIVCEDTRHTGLLLKHFEIPPKPLISFYDEVETQKIEDILALVDGGQNVALVSDAGTPLIADPGYKLVREALKRNLPVTSVPGPVAAVAGLTISGLPPDKFLFLGYPPEKESHQAQLLSSLAQMEKLMKFTSIFLVSPHKTQRFFKLLGERNIVIARELTKVHEEVWRGSATEALKRFANPKGELVLLLGTAQD